MKIPSMPQRGGSIEHSVREIIAFIRASRITSVRGGLLRESPNGTTIQIDGGRGGGAISSVTSCAFGEIITIPDSDPPALGIRGGLVHCGDQNWNIDPQELALEIDGVWLVYLEIDLEANRDDDGEILLPGVKTGTRPTGDWGKIAWTFATDYPANTEPVASTGLGTIILPLGKLTIADGAATFERTGCGNFTIGHCAGTLSYSRA
jgi:hypothetical protein